MPFVQNGGVRVHYEIEGAGPPLVMVHGLAGSLADWRSLGYCDALAGEYQLVLVDVRGCGKSDQLYAPDDYEPEAIAADIVAVLDDSGIRQPHYWGYSMGAMIGFCGMAVHHAARCRSLILGGASGERTTEGAQRYVAGVPTMLETGVIHGMAAVVSQYEETLGLLPDWRKKQMLEIDPRARLALARALARWTLDRETVRDIAVPALVYAGDLDPLHEDARRSADLMKSARFVALEGLGHSQAYLEPEFVLPHAKAFLTEIEQQSLP